MAPIAETFPCRRPVGTARRKLARSEDTSTPASPMMASRCLDKNFNVQNRPDGQRTYWPNPWGNKIDFTCHPWVFLCPCLYLCPHLRLAPEAGFSFSPPAISGLPSFFPSLSSLPPLSLFDSTRIPSRPGIP